MSWTHQSHDLNQATLTHVIPTKKLHSPVLCPQIQYTHQSQAHKWAGLTDLMRQLMTKDRNRRAHSASHAAGKRCPNGQTVTEIVDPVTKYHHPGHCSHRAWDHVTVGMSVTMTMAVTLAVGVPQCRERAVMVIVVQGWLYRAETFVPLMKQGVMGGISIAFQSCWKAQVKIAIDFNILSTSQGHLRKIFQKWIFADV